MSVGRTYAVSLIGLQGQLVEVEADISQGLPAFNMVGLPDSSVLQARERVRSACGNAGVGLPTRRITVNLSPASLPKRGAGFDVAIALAVLAAAKVVRVGDISETVMLGELGLDGGIRPIRGVLPGVLAARDRGFKQVLVPRANHAEATLVSGITVVPVAHIADVVTLFGGDAVQRTPLAQTFDQLEPTSNQPELDMADVVGQESARFGLEIAAAGGHHVFMRGVPGSGKTMLAARLSSILPDLSEPEAIEVTAVHSLSGTFAPADGLMHRPPFEGPHHTATLTSLVGGGSGIPQPGAISRAHRGVLFLDEAPEFSRRALEGLRQPLESGNLTLHRAAGSAQYPARFQLIMAANPCPCGLASVTNSECSCSSLERRRYASRLSGPILDRIDITMSVAKPSTRALRNGEAGESSAVMASRVRMARAAQTRRLARTPWLRNAEVPGRYLRHELVLPATARRDLDTGLESGQISMRGYDRVLRLAWSLADLEDCDQPTRNHVGKALALRQGA